MAKVMCWRCGGSGELAERGLTYRCPTCQGTRFKEIPDCWHCGGSGRIMISPATTSRSAIFKTCEKCHGSGRA